MVASLYTATAPKHHDDDPKAPKDALVSAIIESSEPVSYGYFDYMLTRFVDSICGPCLRKKSCFQKRSICLKQHLEVCERLDDEIDVVRLV